MPMLGQEPKHTVGLQKMPGNRLGIQQLTLIIEATLHPPIVGEHTDQTPAATRINSAVS